MPGGGSSALRRTHSWLETHSGWSAPEPAVLVRWLAAGECESPDGCLVAPAGTCPHGLASWWLVLRALDRPDRSDPIPPHRLVPAADRLDPRRADYVAVLDSHHRALLRGDPGYLDPATGLFVLTARTLWERRSCCGQGCRHCPYAKRH